MCEPLTVVAGGSAFMTGGGQVVGEGNAKITFSGNASGTVGGSASGHFNLVNHRTGQHLEGNVTAVLNIDPVAHEMTFCFRTESGAEYTVRWRDNGEGRKASGPDKLTLGVGCTFPPVAILWGVNNADVVNGNIQWHEPGRIERDGDDLENRDRGNGQDDEQD
jgi:hypothetical protein